MPILSIIVPVYGVEKYIERCARSLFEQTLEDIEFIFVDDATNDSSMSVLNTIIEDYPNRIHQVKIIHHDINLGLPLARQTGLKEATGIFVAHCDSDDWVSKEMYETIIEAAIANKVDAVICDYYESDGSHNRYVSACRTFDKIEQIEDMVLRKVSPSVWTKIFKRNLYDNITYPQMSMGEDLAVTPQLLLKSNAFIHINKPLYYYFNNSNSISKKQNVESFYNRYLQLIENTSIVTTFIKEHNKCFPRYENIVNYMELISLKPLLNILFCDNKYRQLWLNTYNNLPVKALMNSIIPLKEKIQIILILLRLYPFKKDRIA